MAIYGDEKHDSGNEVSLEKIGIKYAHAGTIEEISLDKVKVKLRVGKTSKGQAVGELIQGFERDYEDPDTLKLLKLTEEPDLDKKWAERAEDMAYNAALDALESLILAHACEGLDVASEAYQNGILTTLDALANNL